MLFRNVSDKNKKGNLREMLIFYRYREYNVKWP